MSDRDDQWIRRELRAADDALRPQDNDQLPISVADLDQELTRRSRRRQSMMALGLFLIGLGSIIGLGRSDVTRLPTVSTANLELAAPADEYRPGAPWADEYSSDEYWANLQRRTTRAAEEWSLWKQTAELRKKQRELAELRSRRQLSEFHSSNESIAQIGLLLAEEMLRGDATGEETQLAMAECQKVVDRFPNTRAATAAQDLLARWNAP